MAQHQEVKSAVQMQFSALSAEGYEANEAAARAILNTRNANIEDACVFFPFLDVTIGALDRIGLDTESVDAKFQQHTLKAVVQKRFVALLHEGLACNAAAAQAILETRGEMVASPEDDNERVRCVAITPDAMEEGRQIVEANEAAAGAILETRRTQQAHTPPDQSRHANMEVFKAAVHESFFVLLHEGYAANEAAARAINEAAVALSDDARCLVSVSRVEACEPAAQADIEASHEFMESLPCLEEGGTMPSIVETMHRHDFRERVQTFFFASIREGLDANEAAARAILEANCELERHQVADTSEVAVYPLPITAECTEDAKLLASFPRVEACEPEVQDDVGARSECQESSSCLGGHSREISQKAYAIEESMQRHYFRECVHTSFFASVRRGLDANEAAARAIAEANGALKKYRVEGCTELFKRLLHIVLQAPQTLQICSNATESKAQRLPTK